MLSATVQTVDRSNRVSLTHKPYDLFQQGQVVFNHDGNKGSGFYACTLHRTSGTRQLLGAIELNPRTECWQITHAERQPWSDGIPYLSHTEAVDRLIELRNTRAVA